jgi:hypothetical protein
MKKHCLFALWICLSAMFMLNACGKEEKFPGYTKTADGLYYKFYRQNSTPQQPQLTDYMRLEMRCYLHDTLYYDFHSSGRDVYTQLTAPMFAGDLLEAYALMHVGDSASFYVKADSIAIRYYRQDPVAVGLTPEDYFRYEVKIVEIKTQEELAKLAEETLPMLKAASEQTSTKNVEQKE